MDNSKHSWSTIMQASDERRKNVRAPMWAAVVVGLHVVAVGSFLFIQGCGTRKQAVIEPPPPPVMPPRQDAALPGPVTLPNPSFQPPAVEKAPASLEASASQTYVVQSGDSLSKIAAKAGVTAREIAELNNIKDANKIRLGQKLVLPSYAQPVPSSAKAPVAKPAAKKAPAASSAPAVAGSGEYVVRSGDSLSKVAVKNGTTVKALREVNNLKSDMIRIGQKLKLPAGASVAAPVQKTVAAPAPAPVSAPVAAPVAAPVEAIPAVDSPSAITPVETTSAPVVPVVAAPPAEALSGVEMPFEYTVKPGDTLEEVAKTFGVTSQQILDANGIAADGVATGKKIKIPMPTP